MEVRKSTLIKSVIRVAEWKFGQNPETFWPCHQGERISGGVVSDYDMEDGDVIDFISNSMVESQLFTYTRLPTSTLP